MKGWIAAKQDVSDNTDTPDIATLCVFSAEHLGCNVEKSAYLGFHYSRLDVVMSAQSKVNDFDDGTFVLARE